MTRKFKLLGAFAVILAGVGIWTLGHGTPPPPYGIYIDPADEALSVPSANGFVLKSPAVAEGGELPKEFTCDGAGLSPPVAWDKVPPNTKSLALIMHHIPAAGEQHWYWLLYDIEPSISALAKDEHKIGVTGGNSANPEAKYAPPCSKGPGKKRYSITIYALAARPVIEVPAAQVSAAPSAWRSMVSRSSCGTNARTHLVFPATTTQSMILSSKASWITAVGMRGRVKIITTITHRSAWLMSIILIGRLAMASTAFQSISARAEPTTLATVSSIA